METKPRVLVLTPDFPPALGGIQTLVHRVVSHSKRLHTRVVTLPHQEAARQAPNPEVDVRRSPNLFGDRRVKVAVLNAFAAREAYRFRPDLILSGHIVTAPAASLISMASRKPTIQYVYADEMRGRPRLARFAVSNADAVVAISGYTRDLALAVGADPKAIHRIACGVDPPKTRVASDRLRDVPTLVTVARLDSPYKGHDVVMRALPLVLGRVPRVQWLIVGDGSLRHALEEQARMIRVTDHVSFTGSVSNERRDELLASAHVFAMPSRLPASGVGGEGFGIVYLEAGMHRLPVVAGNVAGALDAVVDGETGILVDPTDHVGLADAIADLLLDPERGNRMGENGAQRAAEFSWTRVAREVEDLALGLVSDGGRAA